MNMAISLSPIWWRRQKIIELLIEICVDLLFTFCPFWSFYAVGVWWFSDYLNLDSETVHKDSRNFPISLKLYLFMSWKSFQMREIKRTNWSSQETPSKLSANLPLSLNSPLLSRIRISVSDSCLYVVNLKRLPLL